MNKTQIHQENISTYNTSSLNVLFNFVSNVLTKTKEQESITHNSEMEVATNIATNIFDQTTGSIGTSKNYFSNVINIFRTIYKEPIISTTDSSQVFQSNSEPQLLKKDESMNEDELTNEQDLNKQVEIDSYNSIEELTDCLNNPVKCF